MYNELVYHNRLSTRNELSRPNHLEVTNALAEFNHFESINVLLFSKHLNCRNDTNIKLSLPILGREFHFFNGFGVVWSVIDTDIVVSLRSTDEGPDVSQIAKIYNGGGHRNAAGFKVSLKDFVENFVV